MIVMLDPIIGGLEGPRALSLEGTRQIKTMQSKLEIEDKNYVY